jgi:gliding motility-associated-like protein
MIKLRILFACLLNILLIVVNYGQHENNLWLFSPNEIIDFSTGEPVVKEDHKLLISPAEASFTLSDSLGNVIFHTDSETIINRNYEIMPNGSDIGGDRSSWQGILCVHNPAEPNIYHLFITFSSLHHLVIDLNADNGKGDVISRNEIWPTSKEHITGYPHPCGGVWIITHDSGLNNHFLSFLFRDGLIYPPVISEIGTQNDTFPNWGGQIRLSNSGEILSFTSSFNLLEFFSFDKYDGAITKRLTYSPITQNFNGTRYYTGDFSINDNFFYTLETSEFRDSIYYYQLDISNLENGIIEQQLIGEIEIFDPDLKYFTGRINKGPNGKIYCFHHPSHIVSSIESPDNKGLTCNFIPESIYLRDLTGFFNFRRGVTISPMIEFFDPLHKQSLPQDTILCQGDELILDFNNVIDSIIWENGTFDRVRTITMAGTYSSTFVTSTGCEYSDTFHVEVIPREEETIIQEICPGDSIELAGEWYQIGEKRIDTIQSGACPGILTVQVEEYPTPFHSSLLPSDTTICAGDSVVINLENIEGLFQWADDLESPTRVIYDEGNYVVMLTTMKGCVYRDTLSVAIIEDQYAQQDTILCYGDEFIIGQDTIRDAGFYMDTLTDDLGCLLITEITVEVDSSGLKYDTTRISISEGSDYEWNGEIYSSPGLYTDEKINDNGCMVVEYLELQVEREEPSDIVLSNILSANDDGINDVLSIYAESEAEYTVRTFQIYSRWGNMVHRQSGPIALRDLTWDGKINDEVLPSGVYTYVMIYKRQDSLEEEVKTGTITLIR